MTAVFDAVREARDREWWALVVPPHQMPADRDPLKAADIYLESRAMELRAEGRQGMREEVERRDARIRDLETDLHAAWNRVQQNYTRALAAEAEVERLKDVIAKVDAGYAACITKLGDDWMATCDAMLRRAEAAEADMIAAEAEGKRDYDAMREFQGKFIAADHARIAAEAALGKARELLNTWAGWHEDVKAFLLALPQEQAERAKPERIVAAAIREGYAVFTAPHHHQVIRYVSALTGKPVHGEQGFITSMGRFVSRVEGGRIAREAGQVKDHGAVLTLFSEQLWSVTDYELAGLPVPEANYAQGSSPTDVAKRIIARGMAGYPDPPVPDAREAHGPYVGTFCPPGCIPLPVPREPEPPTECRNDWKTCGCDDHDAQRARTPMQEWADAELAPPAPASEQTGPTETRIEADGHSPVLVSGPHGAKPPERHAFVPHSANNACWWPGRCHQAFTDRLEEVMCRKPASHPIHAVDAEPGKESHRPDCSCPGCYLL